MLKIKKIYKLGGYASKLVTELNSVSTLTGYSKLYHFFDYMSTFILHGCSINQYGKGEFYSLNEFARKKSLHVSSLLKFGKYLMIFDILKIKWISNTSLGFSHE